MSAVQHQKTEDVLAREAALAEAFALFLESSQSMEERQIALQAQVAALEDDLFRTSKSLRLVLDALPAAVIVIEDQQIRHFNTAASRLIPSLTTNAAWETPATWKRGGGPGEYSLPSATGDPRTVQLLTNEQDGQCVIQIQDITENLRSREQAERVSRLAAMGEMSAGIAHQLRTPLATALLYASHLCSETLPEEHRLDFAPRLKDQLISLDKLASSMLEFLRPSSKKTARCNVRQLIADAQHQLEALSRDRKVLLKFDEPRITSTVSVNRVSVVSALIGVVENAIQVSNPGDTVLIRENRSGRHVAITIEDQGPGISPAMVPRLFEPFATDRTTGTGLGLAIARNTIRHHQGDIAAMNRPQGGAVFTITLPCVEEEHK
jgi:two-component system, sensor histidine kinase FlrB